MSASSFARRVEASLTGGGRASALHWHDVAFTWADVHDFARRLALALGRVGLAQRSRIGVVAENRPALVASIYALFAEGHCISLISPSLPGDQWRPELEARALDAVIASSEWLDQMPTHAIPCALPCLSFARDELGALRDRGGAEDRRLADTPLAAIEIMTSGTSGMPKRIAHGAATVERAAESEIAFFDDAESGLAADRRNRPFIMGYPLATAAVYHLFHAAVAGRPLALLERFDVESLIDALRRHRPVVAYIPPAAIKAVLASDVGQDTFRGVRVVRTGGAGLDAQTHREFEARYGMPVTPQYGATEFCGVVTGWTMEDCARFGANKRGSVGRARPGVALRVIESDTGSVLPPDAPGVLEVKVDRCGDEWLRTTDLARLDAEGFLFVQGRTDGAINRGGFKLQPGEIVAVLNAFPGVLDSAVVGLRDARLGEVPVAAVELKKVRAHRRLPSCTNSAGAGCCPIRYPPRFASSMRCRETRA